MAPTSAAASFARPLMDQVVHDLIRRRPLRRVPRPAWRRRVCPSDAAAAARAEAPAADAALHAAKQGNYHRLIDEQARADDASLHALHGRARSRHPVRGDRLPRAVRAAEVRAAGPQREAAAGRRGAGAAVVRSVQAQVCTCKPLFPPLDASTLRPIEPSPLIHTYKCKGMVYTVTVYVNREI